MDTLNRFSENTSFMHEEFMKMQQAYGFKNLPEKDLDKIAKTIFASFNLANSTTKRKLKYDSKIDWAIYTAPHSWLWRLFHKKLWQKCLLEIEARKKAEEEPKEEPKELDPALAPVLPKEVDKQALSAPSSLSPEERLYLDV